MVEKLVSFIVSVFFLTLGGYFLYLGIQTNPLELTDDGFSLKKFYFSVGLSLLVIPLIVLVYVIAQRRKEAYLIKYGLPATAIIISFQDTGYRIADFEAQIDFILQIEREGQSPYLVNHTDLISVFEIENLAPQQKLAVLVDPNKPNNIKIDWNSRERRLPS